MIISIVIGLCSCKKATNKNNSKLLVVHARGISYPQMMNYLENTESNLYFKQMQHQGLLKQLNPITNAVTISNIASYETGKIPREHGVIGHVFAENNKDGITGISGFSKRFDVETFWEKADLEDKKVLKLGDLTLHGKYQDHNNVDAISQGKKISSTQFLKLKPELDKELKITKLVSLDGTNSFSLHSGIADTINFYSESIDNTDSLIVDNDFNHSNGYLTELKLGNWSELIVLNQENKPLSFKIKWIAQSSKASEIYIRPAFENKGYPESFINQITNDVGVVTGWPNISMYTSGQIDSDTLFEEIKFEVEYLMDAFEKASQYEKYDLIMLDYPIMDRIGHSYLNQINNPKIEDLYQQAFLKMDNDFSQLQKFAKQNGFELMITSGHGFSPVHTSVGLNEILQNSGIKINTQSNDWHAISVGSKVSAQIYLNKNLEPKAHSQLIVKIKTILEQLKSPSSGEYIIEAVYNKQQQELNQLKHKNFGDLFLLFKPGYVIDNTLQKDFGTPVFNGDHGYSLRHKDSYGIIITQEECDPCSSTSVAKIIEKKLKLNN